MPFGYGLYTFLKANPVVAWVAGAFAAVATFLSWQRLRDGRIRRQHERKLDEQAQKTSRKVIDKAKEKTHETIRKADEARADIPRGAPSGELPDDIQSVIFDD